MKPTFYILIICSFLFSNLFAQEAVLSNYGSSTKKKSLTAQTGETYELTITTPYGFSYDKEYKVMYYLDAWWLSEIINGCVAISSLSNIIEPLVLVGISKVGDEKVWHEHRAFDYTPSPYDIRKMGFPMSAGNVSLDSTNSGGADDFIDFLTEKAFPYVDKSYPNLSDKGFLGHSFGGLFGVYVMRNRPEIFKNLVLISPSVWWNKSEVLQEELFQNFSKSTSDKSIYLAVGEDESSILVNAIDQMANYFSSQPITSLRHVYKTYPGRNHNSILPEAIYDGLEYLYKIEK